MRHIVNGLLQDGNLVLLAYRSPHRKFYPDCWSFPGGHVEAGESLEIALRRELEEEIGVTPTQFRLVEQITTKTGPAENHAIFYMFAVSKWTGMPEIKDSEHAQLKWMPTEQAAGLENLALEDYASLLLSLHKPS